MNSKSLLVAIAALAVTATGSHAFAGGNYLSQAGLSAVQTKAFGVARELRLKGKADEARNLLLKVGIDEKAIEAIRRATKEVHSAIDVALINNDYEAFREATKNTPLYDIVNTKEDFALYIEAHELKASGRYLEAKNILDDLGIFNESLRVDYQETNDHRLDLSQDEQDALRVARQANDMVTVQEILKSAGLDKEVSRRHSSTQWRF